MKYKTIQSQIHESSQGMRSQIASIECKAFNFTTYLNNLINAS